MKTHGKKYRKVAEQVNRAKSQDLRSALEFLQKHSYTKFDQTAELAFHLGVDVTKSDQAVRGTVSLPHGTGKKVRVIVFATGAAADAARAAGADEVGFADLIEKVKGGWTDFDVAVATSEAMLEVRKLGKVLGPRGLMPNPRTGTVTDDTASAVKQFKAGRLEFKMDKGGNVMVPFGKLSFEIDKLMENARSVIQAVAAARPAAAKGIFIKRLTVTSTMGPGLPVESREYTSAA
jgi:large subunit ribosomal protein L1